MIDGLQHAQRLATLLSGAIKGAGLYPPGHPASLQPFREMENLMLVLQRNGGDLRLAVVDGVLSVGEHLFFAPPAPLQELINRLEEKGIAGLILKPGVLAPDLTVLARLLAEGSCEAGDLTRGLKEAGVKLIEVMEEDSLSHTYNEAVSAVRDIFEEIGKGRIPNSRRMLTVVSSLASAAIKEPAALLGLALIKDYDNYTFQHSVNVGVLSMALSASMGHQEPEVEESGLAGFLHDIGKTRVDKDILNKPGKLNSDEFVEMRKHPEYGAAIVREMEGVSEKVAEAVLGHHIRYDRAGYPEWAREKEFGTTSKIVAVADFYDATTTLRSYQRPMLPDQAMKEIRKAVGGSLDGAVVERFMELTGKYPTGSVVRLDSNEIAVVFAPSSQPCGAAVVKVVMDRHGSMLEEPELRSLITSGDCIVDLVDPLVKGIDVARYF
jgi:putative nucleotidyltransferase with HDIG domain